VVPVVLDAPLTASVIGQFLLARWKSSAVRRWRLFAVTVVTAPLSLAGNALHGALVYEPYAYGGPYRLDLSLLDLHRTDVWIRLVAAMVPAIGIILAVAVTELVLRERARLEELRERDGGEAREDEPESLGDSHDGSQPDDPPPSNSRTKRADPKVLRLARAGRNWKAVAAATGMEEHAAKRALTAARKQIASESQAPPAADSQEVAA
jgi:Mg2+/citrate symporter